MSPQVGAALLALLGVLLVATLIFRWQKRFEDTISLRRERRILYRDFLQHIEKVLADKPEDESWRESADYVRLNSLQSEIELIASGEVSERAASVTGALHDYNSILPDQTSRTYDGKKETPFDAVISSRKELVKLMKVELAK